jgi:tetratricopeptide (TPR) repeat protein
MTKTARNFPLDVVLVVMVGLLAYWNTLDASFHFDDFHNITDNRIIKDLQYFQEPSKANGLYLYDSLRNRYVGYLSFALNYKAHGLDVRGYHIVNLAIHVMNALLLYLLVALTLRTPLMAGSPLAAHSRTIALFSSLLFVSHPLQTQAVTYIVQRFASLATMFYLLSIVLYVKWRLQILKNQKSKIKIKENKELRNFNFLSLIFYLLSLLCALLAMKTKQIAFTLPLVIALHEFSFFRTTLRKRALYLIPLLLTMLVIPLSVMDLDKPVGEIMGEAGEVPRTEEISGYDYLLTELRVVVSYLRLFVFPLGQNLDYDYPVFRSFLEPPVLLSFLFLLAHFAFGIYLFYRSGITNRSSEIQPSPVTHHSLRLIAFGIFWFFITLSVESSIIPLHPIYEHRVYLPSAGLITALVSAAFLITMRSRKLLKGTVVFFIALTAVFAFAAHARNNVWRNEITLWEDVVEKSPRIARPQNNLCNAYLDGGMTDRGMKHCQTAIELDPDFARAHNNLGRGYLSLGQTDRAVEHLREALLLKPYYVKARNNLGAAYMEKKLYDEAIEQLLKALMLDPRHAMAYYNLGVAYSEKGSTDEAMRQFQAAIKYRPDYRKAHYRLGLAYKEKGMRRKAEEHFRKASG